MPALTPEFLYSLESNMRLVGARDYDLLNKNPWWTQVARRMTSGAKKERINWLLDTAKIERTIKGGGQVTFEDIVSRTMEIEAENAAAGLKLKKEQLEDLDGNGVQLAVHWARQMGAYAAYWPQKQVAIAIKANPVTYDAKAYFAVDHPVNPLNVSGVAFANLFTGAAGGSYPGALDLSETVTLDVARVNLQKALAYIAGIAMPNGVDPRGLRVSKILHPPAMTARIQQLTNAKFIAQVAGSGAGSGDIESIVRNWGLGDPLEVPELAAAFGGSDTTCYLMAETAISNELGAWLYVDREPFSIVYHGPQTDADLARIREFQWTTEGRNVVAPGHPYLMFRLDAA